MNTKNFCFPIFGIRHQKLSTNTEQKLYQILQENGVAALETISYRTNRYVQLRIIKIVQMCFLSNVTIYHRNKNKCKMGNY